MTPIKINLGPVRLTIAIGDADKNGALDIVLGLRILGVFEINTPPINLDAALAANVAKLFEQVVGKLKAGKK